MAVKRTGPGVAKLVAALAELDGVQAKTGWFETAKYDTGVPVAYVATIQEFGSGAIPARPFMRPTVAAKRQEWLGLLADGARAVLTGGANPVQVMEAVALQAAGDVAKTIQGITSPPLSPLTVARKGFNKPLVDTGLMMQSVTGVAEKTR